MKSNFVIKLFLLLSVLNIQYSFSAAVAETTADAASPERMIQLPALDLHARGSYFHKRFSDEPDVFDRAIETGNYEELKKRLKSKDNTFFAMLFDSILTQMLKIRSINDTINKRLLEILKIFLEYTINPIQYIQYVKSLIHMISRMTIKVGIYHKIDNIADVVKSKSLLLKQLEQLEEYLNYKKNHKSRPAIYGHSAVRGLYQISSEVRTMSFEEWLKEHAAKTASALPTATSEASAGQVIAPIAHEVKRGSDIVEQPTKTVLEWMHMHPDELDRYREHSLAHALNRVLKGQKDYQSLKDELAKYGKRNDYALKAIITIILNDLNVTHAIEHIANERFMKILEILLEYTQNPLQYIQYVEKLLMNHIYVITNTTTYMGTTRVNEAEELAGINFLLGRLELLKKYRNYIQKHDEALPGMLSENLTHKGLHLIPLEYEGGPMSFEEWEKVYYPEFPATAVTTVAAAAAVARPDIVAAPPHST